MREAIDPKAEKTEKYPTLLNIHQLLHGGGGILEIQLFIPSLMIR